MSFNSENIFGAYRRPAKNIESDKELSEEEILNSNDVELIVRYAKNHKSQEAIDKVREILEIARKDGEEVVQNFLESFKECKRDGLDYLNFEETESGKMALSILEKMPEPYRTEANKKLENYKKELNYNSELFKKHQDNPEEIWKEVFGFDYYNVPEFKERFKTFFFKNMAGISEKYYKKNALNAELDPFSVNFFVEDRENFNKAYGQDNKDIVDIAGGFSKKLDKGTVNLMNIDKTQKPEEIRRGLNEIITHESEHAIHRQANPHKAILFEPDLINEDLNFESNADRLNHAMKFDYEERLKRAKDEIFAYLKGGADKEDVSTLLIDKDIDSPYDYNRDGRELNMEIIDNHKYFSESEKNKLKEAINFLQSEYDRVAKNMIEVIYEGNQSVEFFRNVPINELWKYSDGKYIRTDFIIKDFKF